LCFGEDKSFQLVYDSEGYFLMLANKWRFSYFYFVKYEILENEVKELILKDTFEHELLISGC
jgi:hypothetical protein